MQTTYRKIQNPNPDFLITKQFPIGAYTKVIDKCNEIFQMCFEELDILILWVSPHLRMGYLYWGWEQILYHVHNENSYLVSLQNDPVAYN